MMKKVFSVILVICMLLCAVAFAGETAEAPTKITSEMRIPETTDDGSVQFKVWNLSNLGISYLRFDFYLGDEYAALTASCPNEGEDFYRSEYSPEAPEDLQNLRIRCYYGISGLAPEDAIIQLMMGNPAEEHEVDAGDLEELSLEPGRVYHLLLLGSSDYAGLMVLTDDSQGGPGFAYVHDPRENDSAMADIIENPDAVYGFSPDPASTRLGSYAEYDWTDPTFVAQAKKNRRAYHESLESMTDILFAMREEGATIEEMARAVSVERNRLRLAAYDSDPEGLATAKESNLQTYGQEEGPTPDQLFEKYGSWTTVLQKAFSPNLGMDACCGLYDEYYWLYIELGYIEE